MFGWMNKLYNITDEEILTHAGLDAYVFLGFFKTAIQLLSVLTICAATIISPIRWYYTGKYDQGDDNYMIDRLAAIILLKKKKKPVDVSYEHYLWVYVVFSYIFTALAAFFMIRQTIKVLRVRQLYLGKQNAVTDRTIKLSGVPSELQTEKDLKQYIESLGIGQVRRISFCKHWKELDDLFRDRQEIILNLESAWATYLGPTTTIPENTTIEQLEISERKRPTLRLKWFGEDIDAIEYYTSKLTKIDSDISVVRTKFFPPTDTAFVTMDSVASAQMAAQAVLDPRPQRLIATTAPAPHDVIWSNLYKSKTESYIRTYTITVIIAILTVVFIIPVSYIASFLNPATFKKFFPKLFDLIEWDGWTGTFITGILPTLVFTLLNFLFPFLYMYLSTKQSFVSSGDLELSVVSKNFFYVFFNMFMVFTIAGTVSDYLALLKDTTKLAVNLAKSLTRFSLFYIDLIILQGIGMYPFKLLHVGSFFAKLRFLTKRNKSPRDIRGIYKPGIFNYGLNLPQPILILIIVLLYSIMSSKILFFGAIYFLIGYYTHKYQLMFSMVHPQHSTGRSWVIIFRRFMVGIIFFHITMTGILALHKAYILATLLTPLPILTLAFWYNFEDDYVPLSYFIALTAIETTGSGNTSLLNEDMEYHAAGGITLDEEREKGLLYINPNVDKELEGPWIGRDGDRVIMINNNTIERKKLHLEEWE